MRLWTTHHQDPFELHRSQWESFLEQGIVICMYKECFHLCRDSCQMQAFPPFLKIPKCLSFFATSGNHFNTSVNGERIYLLPRSQISKIIEKVIGNAQANHHKTTWSESSWTHFQGDFFLFFKGKFGSNKAKHLWTLFGNQPPTHLHLGKLLRPSLRPKGSRKKTVFLRSSWP